MLEGLIFLGLAIVLIYGIYRFISESTFYDMNPDDTHDLDIIEQENYWREYR